MNTVMKNQEEINYKNLVRALRKKYERVENNEKINIKETNCDKQKGE